MRAAVSEADVSTAATSSDERRVLAQLLDDLASVLFNAHPLAYVATPLPGVSGSVGEHVRHILDHVSAFATARPHGVLTYDRRERGTFVEVDLSTALRSILRLKAMLAGPRDPGSGLHVPAADLDAPVIVMAVLRRDEPPVSIQSTLRRELAFVISHTIHHQALIAVLLTIAGAGVPDAFGLSPSTPRTRGC